MHPTTQPHIPARLQRILRWVGLWAIAMQAFLDFICAHGPLSREAERFAHSLMRKAARGAAKAIVVIALHTKRTRNSACPVMRAGIVRACIGAKLRKALRHRDVRARIAMIARVVRDATIWIARARRRFEHRLLRRCARRKSRRCHDALSACFAPVYAKADTS